MPRNQRHPQAPQALKGAYAQSRSYGLMGHRDLGIFDWDPNNTFVLGADGAGTVEAQGAGRDGSAFLRHRAKPCTLSQPAACQILS